jgi:hypothetical protein
VLDPQRHDSERHHVAGPQPRGLHAHPVAERAVARAEVAHEHVVRRRGQLRVPARDGRVGEHDAAVGRATDDERPAPGDPGQARAGRVHEMEGHAGI